MKKTRHSASGPVSYMSEARRKLDDANIPASARKSFLFSLQKYLAGEQSRFPLNLSSEELTAWINTFTLVSKYLFSLYPTGEEEVKRRSPQSKEDVPIGRFYRVPSSSESDEEPAPPRSRSRAQGERQTPSFINVDAENQEQEPAAAGFSVDPRTGLMTVKLDAPAAEEAADSSESESDEKPQRKSSKRVKRSRRDRRRHRRVVESSDSDYDSDYEYEEERPKRRRHTRRRKVARKSRARRSSPSYSSSEYTSEEERKQKPARPEPVVQKEPEEKKKAPVKKQTKPAQKRPKPGVVKQQVSPRLFPPGKSGVDRRVVKQPERPSSPLSPEDKPVGRFFVVDHEDKPVPATKRKLTPPAMRKSPSQSSSQSPSPAASPSPPRVTPPPIHVTPPRDDDDDDPYKPRDTPRPRAKRTPPQVMAEEADESDMSDDFVVDELIDAPSDE